MPAFTARMNMYLPGGGTLGIGGDDEVADIDRINQGLQKIDASIGIPSFPVASLPENPFQGQIIEIEDTGAVVYWDDGSGQWKQLKAHVGTEAPTNPVEGDLWVDTN